jgi:hypothetical protein
MGKARAVAMGIATVLGLGRQGWFIPYSHAETATPAGYPALEPLFARALPAMRELLGAADALAPALRAIEGSGGLARFDQDWFPTLDAVAAYTAVRVAKPARIMEIGSGHSTRFMARAVADGGISTAVTCIDPEPRATIERLGVRHVAAVLSDAPAGILDSLAAGDILFVDSSHIGMPGTDVDRLVLDVLPRLPAGVLLHVHDVFLPDPYPESWAFRNYNEQMLIGALLQGGAWEVRFASHWLSSRHPDLVEGGVVGTLPRVAGAPASSLWLRKTA